MQEITAKNTAEYLRSTGRVVADEPIEVRELTGGVSNEVLLVTLPARGERLVLKQARGRLRVKEDWQCSVERIWREVEVLRICGDLLGQGRRTKDQGRSLFEPNVPGVLWEDRENYLYAMTAAAEEHRTWKMMLLGDWDHRNLFIAVSAGRLLGRLHAGTWGDTDVARQLDDRTFFDQLRLDPYYRFTASVHADRAPHLQQLVESVWSHRLCLVHGDFSPKNLLVWPGQTMLIDFEVGHFGDPAFDLGFFLAHLVAKSVRAAANRRLLLRTARYFWMAYREQLATVAASEELSHLKQRMMLNLAGCLLARADGKSPLEYLTDAERQAIRTLGREWLLTPPDRLTSED
jgi:5-methylthioribose kinase